MRVVQALSCAAAFSFLPRCTLLLKFPQDNVAASMDHTFAMHTEHNHCIRDLRGFRLSRGARTTAVQPEFPRRTWLASCNSDNAAGGKIESPAIASRGGGEEGSITAAPRWRRAYKRVASFCNKRFFLLGAATVIYAARLQPGIGATGGLLRPEITVNKAGEEILVLFNAVVLGFILAHRL